ncbi:uncharacterized protein BDV17DRAFT_92072 [Aspergillus undulatus]|uniref:uncharacterized protein n=1 Tax=Aspergillus undulatus TaxID=1810928 RepID=UPI003CCDF148
MPKSTKGDSKTVTVDVEEFSKTRDSVLASIAQLQSAAYELSRAYINHANQVLGKEHAISDVAAISTTLAAGIKDSGALASKSDAETGEKKKRKRARADPNAPKRTLTPYFLYMHHNRDHIREELGEGAKPMEVSAEGTRRWGAMPESQKEVWKKLYADNLATYREKVKAYKSGLPYDKDDNDRAADQLHLDVAAAEGSNEDEEEEDREEEEEDEDEEEESEPEPVKEPTPPPKRRRSQGKPSKEASTPVTDKKSRNESPEKKRRGSAKKDTEKSTASSDKRSKKKRKSEAGGDDE